MLLHKNKVGKCNYKKNSNLIPPNETLEKKPLSNNKDN